MASDDLYTSTPLQCRHDSGFKGYPEYGLSQKVSPIRKQPGLSALLLVKNGCKFDQSVNRVSKQLTFTDASEISIVANSCKDKSDIGSSISKSSPRIQVFDTKTENSIDENSNIISNSQKRNELYKQLQSTDSGIECSTGKSLSKSQHSLDKKIISIDENSNIICSSYKTNEVYQPFKYICKDHLHGKESKSIRENLLADSSEVFTSYKITDFKQERIEKVKIDFLNELNKRNCTNIISEILSYLPDEDVVKTSNVSKKWKCLVLNDKKANERRKVYLNNKRNAIYGDNKENKFQTVSHDKRNHKSAFTPIANIKNETKQPPSFNFLGKFDSFIQELKTGDTQALMKCPKCHHAAKLEFRYKYYCTRSLCKYEFCKKCLAPYLGDHICFVPELNDSLPNIIVCSKKSRKNLRRLRG